MSGQIFEIFDLLAKLVSEGRALFFYHHGRSCQCCVIADISLEFYEEVEGSFRVRYQCLEFLWMRETIGWDVITTALANVTAETEDDDVVYSVNRHMYELLHRRLLNAINGVTVPSTRPTHDS